MQVDAILNELDPEADVDMYIKATMNSDATCKYGTALELLDWATAPTQKQKTSEELSSQDGCGGSIDDCGGDDCAVVVHAGCDDHRGIAVSSEIEVGHSSIVEPPASTMLYRGKQMMLKKNY